MYALICPWARDDDFEYVDRILLLDEATSALDNENERYVVYYGM